MKKKIVIFLILFSGIVFLYNYIFSPLSNSYRNIEQIWGVNIPFQISSDSILKENSYWGYLIIEVSKDEKKKLLDLNLEQYGYTKWMNNDENIMICDNLIVKKNEYYVSKLNDEGDYRHIRIFISKQKDEMIFLNYNWSGY